MAGKLAIPRQWKSQTKLSVAMRSYKSSSRGEDWRIESTSPSLMTKLVSKGEKWKKQKEEERLRAVPTVLCLSSEEFLANMLSGEAE